MSLNNYAVRLIFRLFFKICSIGEGVFIMIVADTLAFGKALQRRRKQLGYTQAFVAQFSGFSVSFISDLENGKQTAELGKAIYLANLLGLDCSLSPRGE